MKKLLLTCAFSAVALFVFAQDEADEPDTNDASSSKMIVAVEKFENAANAPNYFFETLRDRITSDVLNTRKFDVVERQRLKAVLSERVLAESGMTEGEDAPESGKMKAASYIIYGKVLSYNQSATSMAMGDVASAKVSSKIEVQLRFANGETGKILASKTVTSVKSEAAQSSAEMRTNQHLKGDSGDMTDALSDVSQKVVEALMDLCFPTKILKIGKNNVRANLTAEQTKIDDVYNVFEVGEEMVDPDTGESLGADEEFVGRLRVSRTSPKFSTLVPYGGLDIDDLEEGMILRRISADEMAKIKKQQKAERTRNFESRF